MDSNISELKYYRISREDIESDGCLFGAFPDNSDIRFVIRYPKTEKVSSIKLILHSDGLGEKDGERFISFNLNPTGFDENYSYMQCTVSSQELLSLSECRLYYYCYELYFEKSVRRFGGENAERLIPLEESCDRQLMLYDSSFSTSEFLKQGTIYHIFVDRFASSGRCKPKRGAVINPDWDNGIPQYAQRRGDPLKNNEFFGGDIYGIIDKLNYIKYLGVTALYLSPIFDAASNHKYDTADYMHVDPMFGGDEAFSELCTECKKLGISVILDGVFNHTGDDSIYFNRSGNYDKPGAYNSKESEYYQWYNFSEYPDKYECWWGIDILPRVNCDNESFRKYIFGEKGVIRKYMRIGASGFRLDVADELSDEFISELRSTVKDESADGIVIGEVWEDASNKISYGKRRKYLSGGELDSVMNYPLRNAVIKYFLRGDYEALRYATEGIYRHYPKCVSDVIMNFLGTHDTERILTVLGGEPSDGHSPGELSSMRMSDEQLSVGITRLKCAYTVVATVYGVPSIYYGDEAGLQGYYDPFCRMPYPWKHQNYDLIDFFRSIGKIRSEYEVFKDGFFKIMKCDPDLFMFERFKTGERIITAVTRNNGVRVSFELPVSNIFCSNPAYVFKDRIEDIKLLPWTSYIFKQI